MSDDTLQLTVTDIRDETPSIRRLVLARPDRAPLPTFEAGAHITLELLGVGQRKYSLVRMAVPATAPTDYCLGVRLELNGGGGSRAIHTLRTGDLVMAGPPQNNFALRSGVAPVALVGGGIGVTPLISMAAELAAARRPFHLYYAARSAMELAFQREIAAIAGNRMSIHLDDVAGRPFDMPACFAALAPGTEVYMCGPKPMLKAGMDAAKRQGWPRDRLKFELFYSVATAAAPKAGSDGSST